MTEGLNFGPAAATTGLLTINGTSMHTHAWAMLDLIDFWPGLNRSYRWGNDVIPTVAGTSPNPVYIGEFRKTFDMAFTGRADPSGNPPANGSYFEQLLDNLQAFDAAVVRPPTPPATTVAATFQFPDSPYAASFALQVVGFNRGVHVSAQTLRATIDLVVPAGEIAYVVGS
jgi:hypothetical protein